MVILQFSMNTIMHVFCFLNSALGYQSTAQNAIYSTKSNAMQLVRETLRSNLFRFIRNHTLILLRTRCIMAFLD